MSIIYDCLKHWLEMLGYRRDTCFDRTYFDAFLLI